MSGCEIMETQYSIQHTQIISNLIALYIITRRIVPLKRLRDTASYIKDNKNIVIQIKTNVFQINGEYLQTMLW